MNFNLNEYVLIQLTPTGIKILREEFDEMHTKFPKAFPEFKLPKEDKNGWSKWQMWRLMHTFGKSFPNQMPFNLNIVIPEPKEQ